VILLPGLLDETQTSDGGRDLHLAPSLDAARVTGHTYDYV
jgi:hypothetical protein